MLAYILARDHVKTSITLNRKLVNGLWMKATIMRQPINPGNSVWNIQSDITPNHFIVISSHAYIQLRFPCREYFFFQFLALYLMSCSPTNTPQTYHVRQLGEARDHHNWFATLHNCRNTLISDERWWNHRLFNSLFSVTSPSLRSFQT